MKDFKRIFSFLLVFMAFQAIGQQRISGVVLDELGMPVIGANVLVENTMIGTVTDIDGAYILSIPDTITNPVIVYSFIGYLTRQEPLAGRSIIDVRFDVDSQQLDEIIVVGYSSQSKADVTGALNNIKGKDLQMLPVAGIDQALQGRAAGVNISQVTGAPGEGVSIRIRGTGSLNSSNEPLYIVDGVPTRDVLNIISPQDVEDITILKDASAAAIYGSRANNGVILITTKSGVKNKSVVNINSQVGVQVHGKLTEMTNRDQYIEMYNEAATNDNVFFESDLFKRDLISAEYAATLPDIDHMESIFQEAIIQNYGVTASGGGDKTQYLLSATYFDQEGIIKGSGFDRITGRINLKSEVNDWLTTGINLNLSRSNTTLIGSSGDGAGGNGGSVVRYAYFRTPAIPIYDADGEYVDLPDRPDFFGDGYNPVGLTDYFDEQLTTDRYFGKVFATLDLAEDLSFTSNFGFDQETGLRRRFDRNWGTNDRINNPNGLSVQNTNLLTWTNNNVLSYKRNIGAGHKLNALIGTETIKTQGYASSQSDRDFPDQDPNLVYLGNGLGFPNVSESRYANTLVSLFGKVDYNIDDKYLLSVSLRRDGSSRFAAGNQWGTFYAVSGAWNLHNEEFLIGNSLISQLKLRVGYGEIGNQEIGNYSYSDLISINFNYPFGGVQSNGYAVTQLGNTDVRWETSRQVNAGVDFEMKEGMIYGSIDYFYKLTSNMLVKDPNPPSSGYSDPPWVNNGEILNSGVELMLGIRESKGDFGYSISGNVALLNNEVMELSAPITAGSIGPGATTTRTEVGQPIGSFYMLEMDGIFQNELDIATSAFQGNNIRPGDVKFKDQNGDSFIDEQDRTHVGSAIPKYTLGLNLSANYKNWDMTLFFQGAYDFDIYNVAFHDIEGFFRPFNLTRNFYDNRWTGEGTTNEVPRASWTGSNNNVRISTRFLKDGSYTRLKNVQLGYNFPRAVTDKLKLTRLRVYFSALNLLTFTKYDGLDPEMTTSDNATNEADLARGIDWGTFPSAVSYNMGFNISF
ncbi:MAG: TonB-dependent receptor [Cyclobacteriaceae bacterium]